MIDADIVVIGGGCAGLSLATLLAQQGSSAPGVLVLEPRAEYGNDRTWSGWRAAEHPFLSCVRASWSRWAVSYQRRDVVRTDSRLPYDTIPADRFYDTALAAVAGSDKVHLHRGVTALQVDEHPDRVSVTTDQGQLCASLVIDTRPPPVACADGLLQSFIGLEVEAERACFTPDTVGLMAFEESCSQAITFVYTLPFSPTRALIELTHMSPRPFALLSRTQLADMLRERLGCDFAIIREETGCLPMRPPAPASTTASRLIRLGTPAGALRASTGYGFANIQAQCAQIATTLRSGTDAAIGWQAPLPPAWMQAMDRMFLRILRRRPEIGPAVLTTLFRRCPTGPLVRFLSGTGSLMDGGQVALSMPKLPFMRDLAFGT